METYSAKHPEMPISYAAGYAISLDFAGATSGNCSGWQIKHVRGQNRAKIEEATRKQQKTYELLEWIQKKNTIFRTVCTVMP